MDKSPSEEDLAFRTFAEVAYDSGWCSRLFFCFMNPAMRMANKRTESGTSLQEKDVYKIPKESSARHLSVAFWTIYEQSKSMFTALRAVVGFAAVAQIILLLFYNLTQYAGPICLNLLLEYYTDKSKPDYYGYVVASVLVGLLFLRSFLVNHGNDYMCRGQTSVYAAMYTSVYNRLLALKESSKGTIGIGRILNFFTTDATFIADVLGMINNVWIAPMHLIICVSLLYMQVDWAAFIGVGIFAILGLMQTMVMGSFIRNRFQSQAVSDIRTKLLQEFLDGIRILKYYAWERFAHSRINDIRQKELKVLATAFYLRIFQEFLVTVMPAFTMLIVFVVYAKVIGDLTVAKVFTVISLFKILQMPLWSFVTSSDSD